MMDMVCYNKKCNNILMSPKNGWRCCSGHFAHLCHPCASAYEEGRFCETFHLKASGWRCCETCGKQIHCGCIVSFHMFVLLDAGGIECMSCARKSFILTPNPAWPPPSLFLPLHTEKNKDVSENKWSEIERIKDVSRKNWCHIAGSGPVPWRQAPSLFGSLDIQPDVGLRMPVEAEVKGGFQRPLSTGRLYAASFEKKKVDISGKLNNGSLKLVSPERHETGNSGIYCAEQTKLHVNVQQQPCFLNKDTHGPQAVFPSSSVTINEMKDSTKVPQTHVSQPIAPYLNGKQSGQCKAEFNGEVQKCNGKPSGDTSLRNLSFRRYWPRISDYELQQISGHSKSVITPLFEKTLTASDAGKVGRLVLPKICAEAYLPPISHPEGVQLNVQDLKGKEWVFSFRYWPNNNSRMYVLEGVNPCIQSMNLQAGDVVTFNRVEPEGKLVMGFRKASTASQSNQDNGFISASNGSSTDGDDSVKELKHHADQNKKASSLCTDKKAEYAVKEVGAKSTKRNKRKNSIVGPRSKNLRTEKDDLIDLELTWEQAQGLLHPPLNCVPRVVVIEGFEFEEYEDAPVIGSPTIIAIDRMGSSCSRAQESTAKELNQLLPRGKKSAVKYRNAVKQEQDSVLDSGGFVGLDLIATQGEGDVNPSSSEATKKNPRHGPDCKCIVCNRPPRGEDANLSSSEATKKHPRHLPDCTCIACNRSPRGEGSGHVQTCTCNVCLSMKRRFQTLLTRHEKIQYETGRERSGKNLLHRQGSPKQVSDGGKQAPTSIGCKAQNPKMGNDNDGYFNTTQSSLFDLNTRPKRDAEQPPGSESGGFMRLIEDATERYLRQQIQLSSSNGHVNGNCECGNGNGNRKDLVITNGISRQ